VLNSRNIIISRHRGLVEWLRNHGVEGKVIEQATPDDVKDKVVYGVLPLHLACLADRVITIDMPKLPFDKRGVDLSPEEMDNYGATMTAYAVYKLYDFDPQV